MKLLKICFHIRVGRDENANSSFPKLHLTPVGASRVEFRFAPREKKMKTCWHRGGRAWLSGHVQAPPLEHAASAVGARLGSAARIGEERVRRREREGNNMREIKEKER